MARPDRSFSELVEFLVGFVEELNELADRGSAVLVEGERDRQAMLRLGYRGPILTKVALRRPSFRPSLRGVKLVVILTDLDREGKRLAGRYTEMLSRSGVEVSLTQRRRLGQASHGVFLHVENLSRFSQEVLDTTRLSKNEGLNTG